MMWRSGENMRTPRLPPTTTRFCYVAVKGNKYRFEQVGEDSPANGTSAADSQLMSGS